MEYNQVKELIQMMDASTLTDFHLDFENTHISMSKGGAAAASVNRPAADVPAAGPAAPVTRQAPQAAAAIDPLQALEVKEPITLIPTEHQPHKDGHLVTSPIVGTFYASPGPDKPAYAQKGSKVAAGDILCIVEAMKIMNEIKSDKDGEVAEILAADGEMVEFGQPLFRLI